MSGTVYTSKRIINSLPLLISSQSFTARIHQEHLCQFLCQEELRPILINMASRVLEIYVRHVCLIRPLSEGGKMRITSDMAQVCAVVLLYIINYN